MDKVRPPAQKTKYKGYLGLWIYYGTWCLGVQGGCRWVNFGFGTLRRRHELCPLCLATQVSIITFWVVFLLLDLGIGDPPPPFWENFPKNTVFYSEIRSLR